ncbi:lipid II:glycine glycyltransferase FemX [Roseitranquillus sediminis]|uniref:lipid II:glycine glycyltransferase FemX n=1 Tax=Roseitranquillus sediminis TaxID=2809051 RepID=UPI001D0C1558|nr:GNAT family N-acetyltransferase [Roseitranquillus sediminis]MBM9593692.1 GNAT family N-acetyltransferase [Roseitranquillus sediminis]
MEIDWTSARVESWRKAAAGAPLQQDWDWGEILSAAGAQVARAVVRSGGAEVALAQVLLRRFGPATLALVSRGPVWLAAVDQPAVLHALRRSLPARGPRALVVTPDDTVRGMVPLVTPTHVAELNLKPTLDDLRAGLHGKWRNRLAAAGRAGLTVRREDRPDRYAWLLEAEAAQARQRGYRGWPPNLVPHWHRSVPGRVHVLSAWCGGERVAAMLFLRHGRRATYQIGWSGPDGRATSAHNLCLWTAIEALRAEGVALLDLGTVDTEAAPGLARFKIGCGARVRRLGPTMWVPPLRLRPRGR